MSDGFHVDPEALDAAVQGADAAGWAMGEAVHALEEAEAALGAALTLNLYDGARHKVGTFVRQWREELGILGASLTTYNDTIREVAAIYRDQEVALTVALEGEACEP